MTPQERQSLDNYITGNWGEDNARYQLEDELRYLAGRARSIIRYLQEEDGPDNGCAEIVGQLRIADAALTRALDLAQLPS